MPKKQEDPVEIPYFKFVNKYHKDTIAQKKARRNPDGSVTTVMSTGITHPAYPGFIFTVPSYNRDTGAIMDTKETYSFWKDKIPSLVESGELIPYEDTWVGKDMSQHPLNILTKQNHQMLDNYKIPETAYGYDFTKKK